MAVQLVALSERTDERLSLRIQSTQSPALTVLPENCIKLSVSWNMMAPGLFAPLLPPTER